MVKHNSQNKEIQLMFNVLTRQTIDIINIINVMPVSLLLTLKQLSTFALVLVVALWNLLL